VLNWILEFSSFKPVKKVAFFWAFFLASGD
jgi:hypothetical protein